MTNKIIVVDACEHCSLREYAGASEHRCTHAGFEGMDVTDAIRGKYIHRECPLTDER